MSPNQTQGMASHQLQENREPFLDFPPPESPMFFPPEMSVAHTRSTLGSVSLWINHVTQGIPLPSRATHVPETGGLDRC